MAADKWLKETGLDPDHVDHRRGNARNQFTYRGKVYKPNSEIVFEDKRLKILGRMGELLKKRRNLGFKKEGYWEMIAGSPQWEELKGNTQMRGFVTMLGAMLEYEPEARPTSAEECLKLLHE